MSSKTYVATELVSEDSENPMSRIAQMLLWVAPNPEDVKLHVTRAHQRVIVEIEVVPADRGKIIGKHGVIISAIRTLFLASILEWDGMIYDISLLDDDRGGRRMGPVAAKDYEESKGH